MNNKDLYSYIDRQVTYEPIKRFRELMIEAVRDSYNGALILSGGLDSGVIACIASKILGLKIKTYSSILDGKYGEKEYIDLVNDYCGAEPHYVFPKPDSVIEILEMMTEELGKPILFPMQSQFEVFKSAVEKGEKVLVTGLAGDELLAGYKSYKKFYEADNGKWNKSTLRIHLPWLPQRKARWQDRILRDDFIKQYKTPIPKRYKAFTSSLNQEMYEDLVYKNMNVYGEYWDIFKGVFNVELRHPFVDYRVVTFLIGLHPSLKWTPDRTKYILREAFKDILPEKLYNRTSKLGFPTPMEYWFREELKEETYKILSSPSKIIDSTKVLRIFAEHQKGTDWSRILWRALAIKVWENRR